VSGLRLRQWAALPCPPRAGPARWASRLVNLASRSRMRKRNGEIRSPGSISRLRLPGSPCAVRVGGHALDVHVPGLHLHDEQHVRAPEEDRVHLEQITRQQPVSFSARERPPGSVHVPRGRRPPPGAQDPPRRRVADLAAEPAQFTVHPAVSAGRVLPRQPRYRVADVLAGPRAAGPVRVGPLAGDQPAVPCQQRARADQPAGMQDGWQRPGRHCQDCPVSPVWLRAGDLPPQPSDFMTEHHERVRASRLMSARTCRSPDRIMTTSR